MCVYIDAHTPKIVCQIEIAACLGEGQHLFLDGMLPGTVSLKKYEVNSSPVGQECDPLFLIVCVVYMCIVEFASS